MDEGNEAVVSVVTSVAPLARALSYRVPPAFKGPREIGSRVAVPLHGRTVSGWIVEAEDDGGLERTSLRVLSRSQGYGPPQSLVSFSRFASRRWAGSIAHFLAAASPATIVKNLPIAPGHVALGAPDNELGRLFALAVPGEPTLIELGPAHDPFDIVLGALSELSRASSTGSLLVMVPSRGYAQRLSSRLSRRGVRCVELSEAWDAARAGWPVVIGTRNLAFAPVPELAGVIALDAEDPALTSTAAPTYSAVDVLAERARLASARMLAITPLAHARILDGHHPLVIGEPREEEGWAEFTIVNRLGDDPRSGWISDVLVQALRSALEVTTSGVAACCVLNRKGRARLLICKRCDAVARCDTCDAAVALDELFHCPRCGEEQPAICKSCGSLAFKQLRLGTQKISEDLGRLLGVTCSEVTAETKDHDPRARVLVGTEATLNRIRETALVAFLDIDHHLLAARASAEIETLRLLARASRLVGGRGSTKKGCVVLQTRLPRHRVFDAVVSGNPRGVLDADRKLREQLGLPPFRAMATVSGPGRSDMTISLRELGAEFIDLEDHAVVVAANHEALADLFEAAGRPKAKVRIAVDPEEF